MLAVSSSMFVMASLLIAGKQERTQFAQAMRDTDSRIVDIANDVSTGYFPNDGSLRCVSGVGSLNITSVPPGSQPAGTNEDCIFIGKVLQFAPDNDRTALNIHTVLGRREMNASGRVRQVTALHDAWARGVLQTVENVTLDWGLQITKIQSVATGDDLGAIGFYSSLGPYATNGDMMSGTQAAELLAVRMPVPGDFNKSAAVFADEYILNALDTPAEVQAARDQTRDGVKICFNNGGGMRGSIVLGNNNRGLTTAVNMRDGCS